MLCHRSLCASWSPRIAGSELGEARHASVQRSMHLSGRAHVMVSQGGGSSEALKAKKATLPFMLALHQLSTGLIDVERCHDWTCSKSEAGRSWRDLHSEGREALLASYQSSAAHHSSL